MAEIEVESVQQRPLMPPKLYEAAIRGDEQVLIEMLGLEKEDGGDIIVPIKSPAESDTESPAESDHVSNLQSATFMGNTVLHVLCAFNHDVLASKVCKKDGSLLRACNKLLETPLHYAAKGIVNERAIEALLEFARSEGDLILKGVLRDRNCHGETALHVVATCYGITYSPIDIVKTMIEGDLEWADQVDNNGVSSFDLGITRDYPDYIGEYMILQVPSQRILSRKTHPRANQPATLKSNLSSAEIAQELTEISTSADPTYPIHIAASMAVRALLKRDPSMAYLQDSDGLFPVHVAARTGSVHLLLHLMRSYPDCGELVDHHERNFLHIAAEENKWCIFSELLEKPAISPFWGNIIERMMCTPDKQGNTPMHIASEKGNKSVMKIILNWDGEWNWDGDGERNWAWYKHNNIRNRKGQSAFDISVIEVKARMKNSMEIDDRIDKYIQDYGKILTSIWFDMVMPVADEKELNMMDQLQIIGLGAVLITTVAFAAAFTLPGGYNPNGSPLLAGKYLFKAFILAITSAFLQSFFCVLMLMIGGLSSIDRHGKSVFLSIAMYLFSGGARSMVLSFGLGLYLVLAPVHKGVSILILLLAFGSVMLDITPSALRFIIKAINLMGNELDFCDFIAFKFRRFVIFLGVLRFILPFLFIFILALLP